MSAGDDRSPDRACCVIYGTIFVIARVVNGLAGCSLEVDGNGRDELGGSEGAEGGSQGNLAKEC